MFVYFHVFSYGKTRIHVYTKWRNTLNMFNANVNMIKIVLCTSMMQFLVVSSKYSNSSIAFDNMP